MRAYLGRQARGSLALVGCVSIWLLTGCLDFDRYGEAAGAGGDPATGGATAGGAPPLGGEAPGGGSEGGQGEGGQGGAARPAVCGDGIVADTEECDDLVGPAGTCDECVVVCKEVDEMKLGTHCYFLDPDGNRTWDAAKTACSLWREGGYLVAIESQEEQTFLEQWFDGTMWLGGEDLDGDGTWYWVTGMPFGFTFWEPQQPNNLSGEDCVGVWNNSNTWHDLNCGDTEQYICEWAPPKR